MDYYIQLFYIKEYVIILWEFPTQEEVKESGWEKREKKKIFYTPFRWFVLISGTGLVLACRFDSESYYGFGSWHLMPLKILVILNCEKLDVLEVEPIKRFALAFNCYFPMLIHFRSFWFHSSNIIISTWGDYIVSFSQEDWILNIENCNELYWKYQRDIGIRTAYWKL